MMLGNRANAIILYRILQEYSDAEHILTMAFIREKFQQFYDTSPDRRTIYEAVETLTQLGVSISGYEENRRGYYLRDRLFEPSEIRVLTDAVFSFPFLTARQSRRLVKKIQLLGTVHDRRKYDHLTVFRQSRKGSNEQLFSNIDMLDRAIGEKKQVRFSYTTFDINKRVIPRREEPYDAYPYQMVFTNEHYYLVCGRPHHSGISLYRIDRMRNVTVLDAKAPPLAENLKRTVENAVYAYTGEPEEIIFSFRELPTIEALIDRFGTEVLVRKKGDHYEATVHASPQGVRFWALQYLESIEVLKPASLRRDIRAILRNQPYGKLNKKEE